MDILARDREHQEAKNNRRLRHHMPDQDAEKNKARLLSKALELLSKGQISKAVQRITSKGIADIEDPNVMDILGSKYAKLGKKMPPRFTSLTVSI